jgi:hypothetical protein
MELPDFIRLGKSPPALPFLVIGGHAVIAYGYGRLTHDTDFLVKRDDREAWFAKVKQAGLELVFETSAFAQFAPPEGDGFDLMFVTAETFQQMWEDSKEFDCQGDPARFPSLDHLLALKVHALKLQPPHRTSKDAEDVEKLARLNKLNLADKKYEELFLKYGSREVYETILRILRY